MNNKTKPYRSLSKYPIRKTTGLWIALLTIIVLTEEVLSYATLFYLQHWRGIEYEPYPLGTHLPRHKKQIKQIIADRTHYLTIDGDLGWTIKSNGKHGLYRANAAGFRADREYSLLPTPGVLRIAAFGDSYTHCDDVGNQDTWERKLSQFMPGVEVLNFGVGGYGLYDTGAHRGHE